MGRVAGKVAFVTGPARGRGRSHAKRLAGDVREGFADITGVPLPIGAGDDPGRRGEHHDQPCRR